MPVNKNYDLRRKVLNEAFRSRFFTLEELIKRVSDRLGESVSKKTVQDTIKFMRAEGAPIINEPGKGYIYDPKNFNLFEVKANPDSIAKMRQAATILRQIPGLDLHDDLKEVFGRVGKVISSQASHRTVLESLPSHGSCYPNHST